jgi:hypothetical protein
MPRTPHMLALVTLLAGAPLSAGLALAEPAGTSDRASAEPAPPTRSPTDNGNVTTTVHRTAPLPVRDVESVTPATPMPMNLPDEATATEVKNDYGIGMAGLILGTLLVAAIVVGVLFIISRRNWSASH